jgi:hypothetical protein
VIQVCGFYAFKAHLFLNCLQANKELLVTKCVLQLSRLSFAPWRPQLELTSEMPSLHTHSMAVKYIENHGD